MKRKQGIGKELTTGFLLGCMVSFGIILIICAIGAAMISGDRLGAEKGGYVSTIALLFGCAFGAIVAAKGTKLPELLSCGIHGLLCFMMLFCLGILLYDGFPQGVGSTAILCIGSSCGVGLITLRKKGSRARGARHYKIRKLVQSAQ